MVDRGVNGTVQESASIRQIFLRGFAVAGGLAIGRILQVVGGLLLARMVGVEAFGIFALALVTSGMVSQTIGGSIGGIVTVLVAESRAAGSEEVRGAISDLIALAVLAGGVATAALVLCAPLISHFALSDAVAPAVLVAAGPLAALGILEGACQGGLAGLGRQKLIAIAPLASGLVGVALIPFLGVHFGPIGAVIGSTVATIASVAALLIAIDGDLRPSGGWRKPSFRQLRRVAIVRLVPITLGNAFLIPARWAAQALVANQSGGLAAIGYFAAASQIHGAINFLPQALRLSARQLFAQNCSSAGNTHRRFLHWTAAVVIPVIGVIALFPDRILSLYGQGFIGQAPTLIIASLGSLSFVLYSLRLDLALAKGQNARIAIANILAGLTWILCAMIIGGSLGLALGLTLGYMIACLPARKSERLVENPAAITTSASC